MKTNYNGRLYQLSPNQSHVSVFTQKELRGFQSQKLHQPHRAFCHLLFPLNEVCCCLRVLEMFKPTVTAAVMSWLIISFMNIINGLRPGVRRVNKLPPSEDHTHRRVTVFHPLSSRDVSLIMCHRGGGGGGRMLSNHVSCSCLPSILTHALYIAMITNAHWNANVMGR